VLVGFAHHGGIDPGWVDACHLHAVMGDLDAQRVAHRLMAALLAA
jgi:hypothetical protein